MVLCFAWGNENKLEFSVTSYLIALLRAIPGSTLKTSTGMNWVCIVRYIHLAAGLLVPEMAPGQPPLGLRCSDKSEGSEMTSIDQVDRQNHS